MQERIFSLIKRAEALRDAARYADALNIYRKVNAVSRKHNELDGILDSTLAIADIYRMTGDFDLAVKNYEDALEACEALGNKLTAADCMVGMGLSLRAMGMWRDSIKFISAAHKTYLKENDKKGTAFSLWAEAGAFRVAGDIKKAIAKFEKSESIFSAIKFKPGVAYALCGLGGAHRVAGKYKESMDYYRKANRMFSGLKDKFGTAYSHCGIGNAYRMSDRYGDALRHFKKAERLYGMIGDVVSYSYTLWSIANVFKMKKDFKGAKAHIARAVNNFKKTKDPRGIIYCDMTLGEIEFMEGKRAAAEKRLLSALDSAARHGFRLEKCHANALISSIDGLCSGSGRSSCYRKLGVTLKVTSIPFNMP